MLRILKAEIQSGADCLDSIFVELLDVMGKAVPTDPHFSKPVFCLEDPLALVIKASEKHFNNIDWEYSFSFGIGAGSVMLTF